jgi:hypothetical protein
MDTTETGVRGWKEAPRQGEDRVTLRISLISPVFVQDLALSPHIQAWYLCLTLTWIFWDPNFHQIACALCTPLLKKKSMHFHSLPLAACLLQNENEPSLK